MKPFQQVMMAVAAFAVLASGCAEVPTAAQVAESKYLDKLAAERWKLATDDALARERVKGKSLEQVEAEERVASAEQDAQFAADNFDRAVQEAQTAIALAPDSICHFRHR